MATSITCYGGVDEIGGNKLLLEDSGRRVFLDFGKAFGRYSEYFDGVFIKDRVARGLLDPLALGLVPPLRGMLREDLIPSLDPDQLEVQPAPVSGRQRKPRAEVRLLPAAREAFWDHWKRTRPDYRDLRRDSAPALDGILISHAHQDHISDLEYVSPEFPAWGTRLTAFISKVLLDTGPGTSGGPYISPRRPRPEGVLEAATGTPLEGRPWSFLGPDAPHLLEEGFGPLHSAASFWSFAGTKALNLRDAPAAFPRRLIHWPVDHSLYGAVGVALETEAGWVAYTGDLRFHGEQGPATWEFADGLSRLETRALLCEGTRLTQTAVTAEAEVLGNCLAVVRGSAGRMVIADFAPRNVERLLTFVRIASDTGRRLLVQPKDAYLLRAMHLADTRLPDAMVQPAVGLYADPKLQAETWEVMVRDRYRSITSGPKDVNRAPGDFILAFSVTDVADVLDIDYLRGGATEGGVYIFSNSPAYDEEQKADLVRLWNWTQRLGLEMVGLAPCRRDERRRVTEVEPVPGYHASGHATQADLLEFVRRARPKVLIPIHTEAAPLWHELLRGAGIEVVEPRYAEAIALR